MRNLTKASREASRAYQFEYLIKGGYIQTTYKSLDFFTINEAGSFYLKVYRGTAANCETYVRYRTEASRAEAIERYKTNLDSREAYKAEQKEKNKGIVKPTLATLKTFLNKHEAAIFVKVESSFSGMSDCVERVEDTLSHVPRSENPKEHNLGFAGLYLVGSSRDSISTFEDENFIGFNVWNCCGSCIVATPKKLAKVEQPKQIQAAANVTPTEATGGEINIIDYSEKAFAVVGDFSAHYQNLINLGGSYNSRLKCGKGIIFSKKKFETVKDYLLSQAAASTQTEAEVPTQEPQGLQHPELEPMHPLNICDPQSSQYKQALAEYTKQTVEPIYEPTAIISTPENNPFNLEYFKIIWHEGRHIEGATFENTTFYNFEDVQQAFVKLWETNERGSEGGYTKVKCEIKFVGEDATTDRIDITNKIKNGDFNPSDENIVSYLVSISDEIPMYPTQKPTQTTAAETPDYYNNLADIKTAANSGKVISLFNLSQLQNQTVN